MSKLKFILTSIFVLLISSNVSVAEFLETSLGVFQHKSGEYKIIITNDGIFAAQTKSIDPQKFETKNLTKDNVISSCFLRYDLQDHKYQELIVNGNIYLVNGTFNVKLGDLSINIDELNTYTTFVVYDDKTPESQQGILGVIGNVVVTNTFGSSFVALLEANSLTSKDSKGTLEYQIIGSKLFQDKKPIEEGASIGTKFDKSVFKNSCLDDDAVILDSKDLEIIKKLGKEKNNSEIEKIFNSKKAKDVVKDLLIIRVEDSSIILLDYIDANIKIAKKLGETSLSNKTLCLIKNIDLD